jgi:hypothetical protein
VKAASGRGLQDMPRLLSELSKPQAKVRTEAAVLVSIASTVAMVCISMRLGSHRLRCLHQRLVSAQRSQSNSETSACGGLWWWCAGPRLAGVCAGNPRPCRAAAGSAGSTVSPGHTVTSSQGVCCSAVPRPADGCALSLLQLAIAWRPACPTSCTCPVVPHALLCSCFYCRLPCCPDRWIISWSLLAGWHPQQVTQMQAHQTQSSSCWMLLLPWTACLYPAVHAAPGAAPPLLPATVGLPAQQTAGRQQRQAQQAGGQGRLWMGGEPQVWCRVAGGWSS